MLYEKPRMEILKFKEQDVVITSLTGGDNNDFNSQGQEGGNSTSTADKWN